MVRLVLCISSKQASGDRSWGRKPAPYTRASVAVLRPSSERSARPGSNCAVHCLASGLQVTPRSAVKTLALPVWENRISPVFDSCRKIRVVSISEHGVDHDHCFWFVKESVEARVARFVEEQIDVVVCGAITRQTEELLVRRGIEVVAFVAGDADEVLKAFLAEGLSGRSFAMPGCRARRRCGHRRGAVTGGCAGVRPGRSGEAASVNVGVPEGRSPRRHRP